MIVIEDIYEFWAVDLIAQASLTPNLRENKERL